MVNRMISGNVEDTKKLKGRVSSLDKITGNLTASGSAQGGVSIGTAIIKGLSPEIELEEIQGGYRLYVTDINGTQTFDVLHGVNGLPGEDGESITHEWDGSILRITSASGTSSVDLVGPAGRDGVDGKDATSPIVIVTEVDGGKKITIRDIVGEQSFVVLNGINGKDGDKGDPGEQGIQGPKGDKGDPGEQGEDGLSPYIGENGNWWIGDSDTGVTAGGGSADVGDLQEIISDAVDARFFVVTFEATDGVYHGDLTFAQIREKFEAGGNLVARIDGTDYIPLLSAAPHQIIFSGIYQNNSVSLTVSSSNVCTLTATSLAKYDHSHSKATTSYSGFMSYTDKTKLDNIEAGAEVNVIDSIIVNGEKAPITNKAVAIEIPKPSQGPQGIQGEQGPKGDKGDTGEQGPKGEDGQSPTIDVVSTETGHLLTISDINGSKTVEILNGTDGSGGSYDEVIEPNDDDIPKVFFGGTLQQTKDEKVVPFRYISKTEDIAGYAEIKAQGNSSMYFAKKNQTVKMFNDAACEQKLKIDFKGWGKQNKHCYKANWIDISHARNIVSARLWADVVKSRMDYESLPELLKTSPNQGAIDGFPIKVYANGVYQGRYTLNIPKDKWMANMDDELENHCILCGENYDSGCFRSAAKIDESDWTDEVHDTVPESIKTRWNEVISFVINSTDEEFRENLGNYFYVDSLIDYHLFGLASCGLDAYGKNQIYMTYDGHKWIASMYDMDSTWGLYYDGSGIVSTDYSRTSYEDWKHIEGNLLYIRLENLFHEELKARWAELKNGALSIVNIINRFERFTDIAPAELVKEDYASTTADGEFTGIPSQSTNNIQQIRSFALKRQAWTDAYVAKLPPEINVACTGITLSASSLTFTEEGTQTLTATVTPNGCTDVVTWASDDYTVATVNDGVVTALKNGNCTITATCGRYSASCSVEVSMNNNIRTYTMDQYYQANANGDLIAGSESNYSLLEYVEVEEGEVYEITTNNPWLWVLMYDANKNFIKLIGNGYYTKYTFRAESNVKYVRWGCYGEIRDGTTTIRLATGLVPLEDVSTDTTMWVGYTYPGGSGDFTHTGTTTAWATASYYPVEEGKTYKITTANVWVSAKGYDETLTYKDTLNDANGLDNFVVITIPDGVKYVRWSCSGNNNSSVSTIEEV